MKIAIVSLNINSLFDTKSTLPFGGAEVQLYLLIREFLKYNDLKVSVITGDKYIKRTIVKQTKNLRLILSQPLNDKLLNYIKRPIRLFFYLLRENPDIIIQRIGGIETGICAIYAKLLNKKFIFSIAHKYDTIKGGRKGILSLFYQLGLIMADLIIAQSNDQIIQLREWKNRDINNIFLIKSGYDIKEVNINSKKYILWIGRAIKWKRGEVFIKLAKDFPQEQFLMICNKNKNNFYYWNKLKENADKISNLSFIEFIPFNQIDSYFEKAKIFINTSESEGFPNTFIQAMKNKTPIVSLNVNPDNFLEKCECGISCNNSYKDFKKAIKIVLDNREIYQKLSENAYKYVKKAHNIKNIAENWVKVFKSLLK